MVTSDLPEVVSGRTHRRGEETEKTLPKPYFRVQTAGRNTVIDSEAEPCLVLWQGTVLSFIREDHVPESECE